MSKQKQSPLTRAEQIAHNKKRQREDAPIAVAEYYAAQQATIDRTRKLREERLAREAASKQDAAIQ